MNDEELEILESQGYSYDPTIGVITDATGNYVQDYEYNDKFGIPKMISSKISKSKYNEELLRKKQLEKNGYDTSKKLNDPMRQRAQEDGFLAENNLKTFTGFAADDTHERAAQKLGYQNLSDYLTRGTLAAVDRGEMTSMQREMLIDAYKDGDVDRVADFMKAKGELEMLRNLGYKDIKDQAQENLDTEGVSAFLNRTAVTTATEKLLGKERAERFGGFVSDVTEIPSNIINSVRKKLAVDGAGIDENEWVDTPTGKKSAKLLFIDARKKQRDAFKPFALKEIERAKADEERIQKMEDEAGILDISDRGMIAAAKRKARKRKRDLQDFVDDANVTSNVLSWSGIFDTGADFFSLGFVQLSDELQSLRAVKKYEQDQKAGKESSPVVMELLREVIREQEVQQLGLEYNTYRDITEMTNESMKFLVELGAGTGAAKKVLGTGVQKGVKGALKKSLGTKGATKIKTVIDGNSTAKKLMEAKGLRSLDDVSHLMGDAAHEAVEALAITTMMPSSHASALRDMYGQITLEIDEDGTERIVTESQNYEHLMNHFTQQIAQIKSEIAAETDPDRKAALQIELSSIEQARSSVVAPRDGFKSYAYGMSSNLAEVVSEKFVGPAFSRATKGVRARALNTNIGKYVDKSKLGELSRSLTYARRQAARENALYSSINGYIQSPVPELVEEMFVAVAPTAYETETEYKNKIEELATLDFYVNVIGVGVLQRGVMNAKALTTKKGIADALSRSEHRRRMREFEKKLKSSKGVNPQALENLLRAGHGSHPGSEYERLANEYNDIGDKEGKTRARMLKYRAQATEAMRMEMLPEYQQMLETAMASESMSTEDKAEIAQALVMVQELSQIADQYKDNAAEVAYLRTRTRDNEESAARISEKLIRTDVREEWEAYKQANNIGDEVSLEEYVENQAEAGNLETVLNELNNEDLYEQMLDINTRNNMNTVAEQMKAREKQITSYAYQQKISKKKDLISKANAVMAEQGYNKDNLEHVMKSLEQEGALDDMTAEDREEITNAVKARTDFERNRLNLDAEDTYDASLDYDAQAPTDEERLTAEEQEELIATMEYIGARAEADNFPNKYTAESAERMKNMVAFTPNATFEELVQSMTDRGMKVPNRESLTGMFLDFAEAKGIDPSTLDPAQVTKQLDTLYDSLTNSPEGTTVDVPAVQPAKPTKQQQIKKEEYDPQQVADTAAVAEETVREEQVTRELEQTVTPAAHPSTVETDQVGVQPTSVGYSTTLGDTNKVNTNSKIQSSIILTDVHIGTVLETRLATPEEIEELKPMIYDEDSGKEIPYAQYMEKNGIVEGTAAHSEIIPMVYVVGGQIVGYVHDMQWYKNPKNLVQSNGKKKNAQVMAAAAATAMDVRRGVLDGSINTVEVVDMQSNPLVRRPKGDPLRFKNSVADNTDEGTLVGSVTSNGVKDMDGNTIHHSQITNFNALKRLKHPFTVLYPTHKDEHGRQMYRWSQVMTMGENGTLGAKARFDNDLKLLKRVWMAFLTLNPDVHSKIRKALENDPEFQAFTQAEAEAVAIELKALGINIKNPKSLVQLRTISESMFNLSDGKGNTLAGTESKSWDRYLIALFNYNPQKHGLSLRGRSNGIALTTNDEGKLDITEDGAAYNEWMKERLTNDVITMQIEDKLTPNFQPLIKVMPVQGVQAIPTVTVAAAEVSDVVTPEVVDAIIEEATAQQEETAQVVPETVAVEDNGPIAAAHKLLEALGITNVKSIANEVKRQATEDPMMQLKVSEREAVKNELMFRMAAAIESGEEVNLQEVQDGFQSDMKSTLSKVDASIAALREVRDTAEDPLAVDVYINALENVKAKLEVLASDEGAASAMETAVAFAETEDFLDDGEGVGIEKDFNKSATEDDHTKKMMPRVKRLLSSISVSNKNGFLGFPQRMGFYDMYRTLSTIFITNNVDNDFESMMNLLKQMAEENPKLSFLAEVASKLEKSSPQVQRAFVVAMYKFPMNSIMVGITRTDEGDIDSSLFSVTAASGVNRIRGEWLSNLTTQFPRGMSSKDAKALLERLQDLKTPDGQMDPAKTDEARQLLEDLGITLTDYVWDKIVRGEMPAAKGTTTAYSDLSDKFGLFGSLETYLKSIANNKKYSSPVSVDLDENLSPQENKHTKTNITRLVKMEAASDPTRVTTTMTRDGDKSVSNVQYSSLFYDTFKELLNGAIETDYYSDNNLLSQLVEEFGDSPLLDNLQRAEVALTSMKNLKTDSPYDNVDELSDSDREMLHLLLFQNHKGTVEIESSKLRQMANPIEGSKIPPKMRWGWLPMLTISDKGRMPMLRVPLFSFHTDENLIEVKGGKLIVTDLLRAIVYERVVRPELNRILNMLGQSVNIHSFEKGMERFNAIPALNHIRSSKTGKTANEWIAAKKAEIGNLKGDARDAAVAKAHEQFKEEFMTAATDAVINPIIAEAEASVDSMPPLDKLYRAEMVKVRDLTADETKMLAHFDHRMNYVINATTMMQVFIGDPASYYKGAGKATDATLEGSAAISASTGTNISKRLAALIAPGNVMANSQHDDYIQIHLKDVEAMSDALEKIIEVQYGRKLTKEEKEMIRVVRSGDGSSELIEQYSKELKARFPRVYDYMEIETTDAQEYTTLKEHLTVMLMAGTITQEKFDELIDKVYEKGEPLDEHDLKFILQPMKPVYTGFTTRDGVRVMNYVKSSSIPLIPGIHDHTDLGPLMEKMMEMERKTDKTVRASYHTANKVGDVNKENMIDPFDEESLAKLDGDKTWGPSIEVHPRRNHRIQQENTYKVNKGGTPQVSMGTQIMKLLFGNGIVEALGPEGKQLQEEFNELFGEMTAISMAELEQIMDEDGTGDILDGLGSAITSALRASDDLGENEAVILNGENAIQVGNNREFALPLWLIANAEKIESAITSLITKRIFKVKIPGSAYVVASSAGQSDRLAEGQDFTVRVDPNWDGTLREGEVILPARVIVGGKQIDFYEQDSKGNYKYLKENSNGKLVINESKIDMEIFSTFGYRTPTSSHSTGSNIKVVGIRPPYVGDSIIASKDLIPQMGQDHDNDKLTIYNYVTVYNKDTDRIEILNESNAQFYNEGASGIAKDKAIILNKMIDIYKKVYNSSKPKVRQKITRVLSTETAKNQVDDVYTERGITESNELNITSYGYQNTKLAQGASGAAAIGAYAKSITLLSRIQQLPKALRPIIAKMGLTFGNVSKKELTFDSLSTTGGRDVAAMVDERINLATDNAKLGVLGRAGLTNMKAIGVDALLSVLGLDTYVTADGKELSISFMLHTNSTILKLHGLVDEGNNVKSAAATIVGSEKELKKIEKEILKSGNLEFTERELKGEGLSRYEKSVLATKYYMLSQMASSFTSLSQAADIDKLGQNLFDAQKIQENYEDLQLTSGDRSVLGFGNEAYRVYNAAPLLGKIQEDGTWKPTTFMGHLIDAGITALKKFGQQFHPYNEGIFFRIFRAFAPGAERNLKSDEKRTIRREFAKFVHIKALQALGYDTAEKAQELFHGENSLAQYILALKSEGNDTIVGNIFLSALTRRSLKGKEAPADVLELRDSMGGDPAFDSLMLEAIQELYDNPQPLPDRNGEPYDTRMLVEDLFLHNILSGQVGRMPGNFHHLIPVSLYNKLGLDKAIYDTYNDLDYEEFMVEYARNNPDSDLLPVISRKEFDYNTGMLDIPDNWGEAPPVIRVGKKIFGRISHGPDYGEYKELKPVTVDGRNHYAEDTDIYAPEKKKATTATGAAAQTKTAAPKPSKSGPTSYKQSLTRLKDADLPPLLGELITYLESIVPEDLTYKNAERLSSLGRYVPEGDYILINENQIKKVAKERGITEDEILARVLAEELIHYLTSKNLVDLQNAMEQGESVPSEFQTLIRAYRHYQNQLTQVEGYKEYVEGRKKAFEANRPYKFKNDLEINVFYRGDNIKEFFAGLLQMEPEFLEVMGTGEYKSTGKPLHKYLMDLLPKLIGKILNTIKPNAPVDSIDELYQSSMQLLTMKPKSVKQAPKAKPKNDFELDADALGDIVNDDYPISTWHFDNLTDMLTALGGMEDYLTPITLISKAVDDKGGFLDVQLYDDEKDSTAGFVDYVDVNGEEHLRMYINIGKIKQMYYSSSIEITLPEYAMIVIHHELLHGISDIYIDPESPHFDQTLYSELEAIGQHIPKGILELALKELPKEDVEAIKRIQEEGGANEFATAMYAAKMLGAYYTDDYANNAHLDYLMNSLNTGGKVAVKELVSVAMSDPITALILSKIPAPKKTKGVKNLFDYFIDVMAVLIKKLPKKLQFKLKDGTALGEIRNSVERGIARKKPVVNSIFNKPERGFNRVDSDIKVQYSAPKTFSDTVPQRAPRLEMNFKSDMVDVVQGMIYRIAPGVYPLDVARKKAQQINKAGYGKVVDIVERDPFEYVVVPLTENIKQEEMRQMRAEMYESYMEGADEMYQEYLMSTGEKAPMSPEEFNELSYNEKLVAIEQAKSC